MGGGKGWEGHSYDKPGFDVISPVLVGGACGLPGPGVHAHADPHASANALL